MPPSPPSALLRSLPSSLAKALAKSVVWGSCTTTRMAASATGGDLVTGSFDAVVVGAGAHGSAAAWQLASRGLRVLCVEQHELLHARGSSHGESRITRRSYPQAHFTALMEVNYKLWAQAEAEFGAPVFTRTGGLDFGAAGCVDLALLRAAAAQHGVALEELSPSAVAARFPGLTLPSGYEALYSPDAGVLHARDAVRMLQALATRRGATIVDRCAVTGVEASADGVRVTTSRGVATAAKVVIAAGGWTPALLHRLGLADLRSLLTPVPVAVSYWRCVDRRLPDDAEGRLRLEGRNEDGEAANAFSASRFPVFIAYSGASTGASDEAEFYGIPSLERPGLVKISLHLPAALWGPPVGDMDARTLEPPTELVARLVGPFLRRHFPGLDATAPAAVEACVYTMTPDHSFVIDTVPASHGRVFVSSACSGHGFKFSPVVGTILADLATSGESTLAPNGLFSLQRFASAAQPIARL